MEEKKDIIYSSSQQALWKIFILMLTLGISILASLIDAKSCYVTVLVQACNNVYDFAPSTNNKKYNKIIKRESIGVILLALLAVILSIVGLLGTYTFTNNIFIRLLGILFVAFPLAVVYYDYRMNVEKENK